MEGLAQLGDGSAQVCVTSPPYWGLRDYGTPGQIGLEATPDEYVAKMVAVFGEVRRVLREDGTLWLNIGDTYAAQGGGKTPGLYEDKRADGATWQGRRTPPPGLKPKDLVGIPWRVAFALQADGWYLRSDIIWNKPNPMPESVTDRPTKSHEYLFLLTKSARYFYDAEAIKEPNAPTNIGRCGTDPEGRNKRSVWTVATAPFPEAHFATFPPDLIEPCILAGSRFGDTVLDPFNGAATTGLVALSHQRDYVGIELNGEYVEMSRRRLSNVAPMFTEEIGE